jgi:glyoxylase-like metal-dependent hydrolase (beta-lactamase superfamily II)
MWALLSRSWVEVPISVFVLEHRDGLVLFDTGLDPAISSDPNYISSAVGRFFLRKVFRLRIGPEDSLSRNLERLAFSPSDVRKVVFSHLHFDHIGGIREVSPQAELLVSQKEWLQLAKRHPERDWILREHIELPNTRWRQVEFVRTDEEVLAAFGVSHDVMGDGSMVLLPTPGHTPGSMSLLVRSAGHPPLLFVGDLTYDPELLMRDQVPGVYSDRAELKASFAKVRALKEVLPDLLVLGSHDPAAATALASASAQCSSRASGSGE